MIKKKGSLLHVFILFFIIEVALLLVSGNLSKTIQIVNDEGRFDLALVPAHFDLQEKITEEFQRDEYLAEEQLKHPDTKGKIHGSEKLYSFFDRLTKSPLATFQLLRQLLIVDFVLLLLAFAIRKHIFRRPSQGQILFESIYSVLEGFVEETLGKEKVRFTPYIVTIFMFIWTCNMIGMIPIPGFMEPTRNLNVPLGMGVMVLVVTHFVAIRELGIKGYVKGYFEPMPFLMPLDVVGEVAKGVSIAFRLFGNILGGAIIILVVSSLVRFVLLPVGLNMFFGMFVGTIQAFVFTMLSLTYIGVAISE
ncbi:MAG: F0F1 ATP synthase subunit A [Candidatus Cloacimonetes bacterium]|nr:F0F1 ATP synthase subunit A [Candidatus Cloacimonadota bacterium]